MPQMLPFNWLLVFILYWMLLIILSIFFYFFKNKKNNMKINMKEGQMMLKKFLW